MRPLRVIHNLARYLLCLFLAEQCKAFQGQIVVHKQRKKLKILPDFSALNLALQSNGDVYINLENMF